MVGETLVHLLGSGKPSSSSFTLSPPPLPVNLVLGRRKHGDQLERSGPDRRAANKFENSHRGLALDVQNAALTNSTTVAVRRIGVQIFLAFQWIDANMQRIGSAGPAFESKSTTLRNPSSLSVTHVGRNLPPSFRFATGPRRRNLTGES